MASGAHPQQVHIHWYLKCAEQTVGVFPRSSLLAATPSARFFRVPMGKAFHVKPTLCRFAAREILAGTARKTSRGDHGLLTATARRRIHLGSTIAMGCPRQLENRTSVHFAAAHEWCGRSSPLFRDVSRETPPYGTATVRGVTASKPQCPAGPRVSPSCPLCGASGNVHAWLRHIQRRRKT